MSNDIINELNLLSDEMFGLAQFTHSNEWNPERERRELECNNIKFKTKRTKAIKAIARTGIANSARRRWWFVISGGYDLYLNVGDIYENARKAAEKVPKSDISNFGVTYNLIDYLPQQIASILPGFLHTLWYYNRFIEYSPLIPGISAMLLMFLEPNLAYLSMQSIINRSVDSLFYVLVSKTQLMAQIKALEKLIFSKCNDAATHAQKLGIDVAELALAIFPSFFIPFMGTWASLTFLDSFLSEGRKVLFRFSLQILIQEEPNLVRTSTKINFASVLINAIDRLSSPERMHQFIRNAFRRKMKRKFHIEKLEKNYIDENDTKAMTAISQTPEMHDFLLSKKMRRHSSGQEDLCDLCNRPDKSDSDIDHMKMIQARIARNALPSIQGGNLLKESTLLEMRNEMPSIFAHYSANLVFQMSTHGASFSAVFDKCSSLCQYIIVVKTTKTVIGAVLSDPIRPHNSGRYFGTGITFVFDVIKSEFYRLKKPPNNLFLSVSDEAIMIGGPKPSIYFTENFKVVFSEECETFGSPKLTTKPEGDPILDVEIYNFSSQYHFDIPKWKK